MDLREFEGDSCVEIRSLALGLADLAQFRSFRDYEVCKVSVADLGLAECH